MASPVDASFGSTAVAGPCGISLKIPTFSLKILLPRLLLNLPAFPPPLPFSLSLSCDPTKPINITKGVAYGGGRKSNAPADPDDNEETP